jgi:hypothetical protein
VVNQDPFRREELLAVLSGLLLGPAAPGAWALSFTREGSSWELVRDTLLAAAEAPA